MLRTHAVVEFGEPLQIVEQPLPLPMGEEVLVRTTYAGMCHSELHLWEGYFDTGGGNKLPLNTPRPHTLGHEIEGEVIAMGPDVPKGMFTKGKSYAIFPWLGCEKDSCVHCRTKDKYNYCQSRDSKKFVDVSNILHFSLGISTLCLTLNIIYIYDTFFNIHNRVKVFMEDMVHIH